MFDISNPQKRERFLVILAGIALFILAIGVVPAQFGEINQLKKDRAEFTNKINEHKLHARNEEEIKNRLSAIEQQALAAAGTAAGGEAVEGYRDWLRKLADSAGIRGYSFPMPTTSGGGKGATHTKHIFVLDNGEARLDQIAEFLRQFHRSEYLHTIQQVNPRPTTNRQGAFTVTFRIEALSLPQIKLVNMPNSDGLTTDDERQKSAAIRDRAILSEYTPPPPVVVAPPPVVFEHDARYCILNAIVETDGTLQCWIDHRTQGRKYYLFEEGSFMLEGIQCVIKKIDIDAQQIQMDIGGDLYALKVGGNFDDDIEKIEQSYVE